MQIDWDVSIAMEDGAVLRADVFRPDNSERHPVIMTHGVYGKGLPLERFRQRLLAQRERHPLLKSDDLTGADLADAMTGGTNDIASDDYRVWEVVDPLVWVPAGYVCIRVDSRGSGRSPGRLDPLSPQEISDYATCIEWAGTQRWSNGKVGLCGKSYYAMSQWLVAARKPPHLAAICVWHGWSDWYRDATRHGGIMYRFWESFWYPELVLPVQNGADAGTSPHNYLPIAGAPVLNEATLVANRADIVDDIRTHPFDDDHYYGVRTPDLGAIDVPLLASADWSDHDLHLAGTIRGFMECSSREKRLEIHAGGQFDDTPFVRLQQRFFNHYLKSEGDWLSQPTVQFKIRNADGTALIAYADAWPIPETRWTTLYLDVDQTRLSNDAPMREGQTAFSSAGDGIAFETAAIEQDTLIAGPIAATLQVSSSTADADLFLILDAIDPSGQQVELRDHRGGLTSMTVGWQRASHRALDATRCRIAEPRHRHRYAEPLAPDQIYEVQVALRPTCLHLTAGCCLRLTIRGHGPGHDDPIDRPPALFDNTVTLHAGPNALATLLLPIVPKSALRFDQVPD